MVCVVGFCVCEIIRVPFACGRSTHDGTPVSVGDCLHVSNVRLSHISNVCLVQLPLLHVLIYCSLVQIFDFLDSCVLTCLTRLQRLA